MASSAPFFPSKFFDGAAVAAGYSLFAYESGTETLKDTWVDAEEAQENTNPIILNGAGECSLFLGTGAYTFKLVRPVSLGSGVVDTWDGVYGSDGKVRADLASAAVGLGSKLVRFIQRITGAVARWVEDKLSETISVKDFGAVGDSNGTTGNGTDDTAAFEAAILYANSYGRRIFMPSGIYRITAPLDLSGVQKKTSIEGESIFDCAIFLDFTSATKVAGLTVDNTTPRAYASFKNFKVLGRRLANVSGIYSNNAGEFTEFENVWVLNCENGIVVATDYNVKITRCQTWYNTNNGIQIGYTLAGASAPCNNVMLLGCLSTYNDASGFYIYACRALGMVQCDGEANHYTNIFLENCYGVSLTGTYMEYAPTESGEPVAQLWIKACLGVSVDGLSVSAFDNEGHPVIRVSDNSVGVSLRAIAIETSGSPSSAIGVSVSDSFGVSLSASYLNGLTTGAYLGGDVRFSIEETDFSNCTLPVSADDTGAKYVVWEDAAPAQLTASLGQIPDSVAVDATTLEGAKNRIGDFKSVSVVVSFSDLSAAGSRTLFPVQFASERWRVVDIIALGTVQFSGGSGDRLLSVTDGTSTYSAIPSAALGTSNLQARWGSTNVPFPATPAHQVTLTTAGMPLVARYSGGSADYTAGSITITVVAQRVA